MSHSCGNTGAESLLLSELFMLRQKYQYAWKDIVLFSQRFHRIVRDCQILSFLGDNMHNAEAFVANVMEQTDSRKELENIMKEQWLLSCEMFGDDGFANRSYIDAVETNLEGTIDDICPMNLEMAILLKERTFKWLNYGTKALYVMKSADTPSYVNVEVEVPLKETNIKLLDDGTKAPNIKESGDISEVIPIREVSEVEKANNCGDLKLEIADKVQSPDCEDYLNSTAVNDSLFWELLLSS